jgi:hypothetical protein
LGEEGAAIVGVAFFAAGVEEHHDVEELAGEKLVAGLYSADSLLPAVSRFTGVVRRPVGGRGFSFPQGLRFASRRGGCSTTAMSRVRRFAAGLSSGRREGQGCRRINLLRDLRSGLSAVKMDFLPFQRSSFILFPAPPSRDR